MALVDPQRYRQRLIQMASLTDDGLEEITLRLVKADYPEAHRTGAGPDGGIDVLSDYAAPPARAWQCKNTGKGIPWSDCRASLRSAMTGDHSPTHYTFVFPRPLTESERNFWRDPFKPEEMRKYQSLGELDYIDDLAQRLDTRPDLVDLLDDGVLGVYVRQTLMLAAQEGVNPLASAIDLAADAKALAKRAKIIGKRDPHFAYGETGREASARDSDLPEHVMRFSLTDVGSAGRPRYAMAVRNGDEVTELTAEPRKDVIIDGPEPWFAAGDHGDAQRTLARVYLAKGIPVSLPGPAVGLRPGTVPDRFRSLVDEEGLLRNGVLDLGVSEPLTLTATLTNGGVERTQVFVFHRVPAMPGDSLAYAGSCGGAILSLDLRQGGDRHDRTADAFDVELVAGVTLGLEGERPRDALDGLGFARALATAELVTLKCDGLLPPEGVSWEEPTPAGEEGDAVWIRAAVVCQAMSLLNARDGGDRRVPGSALERDVAIAQIVVELLVAGEVRQRLQGEVDVPLPDDEWVGDDLSQLLSVAAPLPPLCGEATNLPVVQLLEHVVPEAIVEGPSGRRRLRCRVDGNGEAAIVLRLTDA